MRVAPRAGLFLVVLVFVMFLAVPSSQASAAKPSTAMLQEINKARQARGLAPLRGSSSLRRTSQALRQLHARA